MRRIASICAIATLALTACAASAVPDEVIAVEAAWLCDLPRFAYNDATGVEAELDRLLGAAGLDRADYDDFKARLDDSADLRTRVAAQFDATCGGV